MFWYMLAYATTSTFLYTIKMCVRRLLRCFLSAMWNSYGAALHSHNHAKQFIGNTWADMWVVSEYCLYNVRLCTIDIYERAKRKKWSEWRFMKTQHVYRIRQLFCRLDRGDRIIPNAGPKIAAILLFVGDYMTFCIPNGGRQLFKQRLETNPRTSIHISNINGSASAHNNNTIMIQM